MLTRAGGLLALLQDNPTVKQGSSSDQEIKVQHVQFGLRKLDMVVEEFWAEISDSIQTIEVVYEDEIYPSEVRQLAALVASKVYFHLGSYEDSLSYALGAGALFDMTQGSQYVETIIAKCIDSYTARRSEEAADIDTRLENIVNRMFDRCFEHGQYFQALGIAIETKRLDVFERAVAGDLPDGLVCDMLSYAFRVVMSVIQSRDYRSQLLRTLVRLYRALATPDYAQMCQCLIFLDEPISVANVLKKLSAGSPADVLRAYQIAFDMYESASQDFLSRVLAVIRKTAPAATVTTKDAATEESMETEGEKTEAKEEPAKEVVKLTVEEAELQFKIDKLASILSGEKPLYLSLQFMIRNDNIDALKDAVQDWLSRATNGANMFATKGVAHRGHEKESLSRMQSYLPKL